MMTEPEPNWRKPVGALLILGLLVAWIVLVVTIIDRLALPPIVQAVAYLIGGLAWLWVLPMRRMLAWMESGG